jgi:Uma2 family endonuclease
MAILTSTLPSLESGDRLTRAEFHRRYCARPDIKKAELVEGVVYVPSPVRSFHAAPHGSMIGWLYVYKARHPDLHLDVDATVLLDADNEPQPDVSLWREEPGGPRTNEKGHIEGAPQLVVEIALSSASYDLHDKLRAYRRAGVREYIVWRALNGVIDWLRLGEGEYCEVEPDERGVIESGVYPGLRLNITKMLAGDDAGVLAELGQLPSL